MFLFKYFVWTLVDCYSSKHCRHVTSYIYIAARCLRCCIYKISAYGCWVYIHLPMEIRLIIIIDLSRNVLVLTNKFTPSCSVLFQQMLVKQMFREVPVIITESEYSFIFSRKAISWASSIQFKCPELLHYKIYFNIMDIIKYCSFVGNISFCSIFVIVKETLEDKILASTFL
jgi:hypothetical protein